MLVLARLCSKGRYGTISCRQTGSTARQNNCHSYMEVFQRSQLCAEYSTRIRHQKKLEIQNRNKPCIPSSLNAAPLPFKHCQGHVLTKAMLERSVNLWSDSSDLGASFPKIRKDFSGNLPLQIGAASGWLRMVWNKYLWLRIFPLRGDFFTGMTHPIHS